MTLEEDVLATWRRHCGILLYLLDHIPAEGFAAVPSGSRGRTVAGQFQHLDRVRRAWLHYHVTGERPALGRSDKDNPPGRDELKKQLSASGEDVSDLLAKAFRCEARIRMFGRQPVRWMAYLISHESHHRGQILLALKQNGMRMPEKIVLQGLWGRWMSGK